MGLERVLKRWANNQRRLARFWMGIAALAAGVLGLAGVGSGSPAAPALAMKPSRHAVKLLNANQRLARARYWNSRLGLQFGMPPGATARAVSAMRQMQAATALSTTAASGFSWQFIGPQPMNNALPNFGGPISGATFDANGRVVAIAPDPTTGGRLFIGASGGGVWMSTDGGSSFTSIADSLPTQAIGAIALDTVNTSPPTIYVATGNGNNGSLPGAGIFKSTDLGNSWTELSPGTFDHVGFAKLAIDTKVNPPRIFAAAMGLPNREGRQDPDFNLEDQSSWGLWRSDNGGAAWTHFAAATFGCQLSSTVPCPADDIQIDPANPSRIYAAIHYDGLFRSTDSGTSWTKACFTNDSPCSFPSGLNQVGRISVAASNATVYAMAGSPREAAYAGFFKSTDGGVSWTAGTVPSWPNPNGGSIDGTSPSNFSQAFFDQALAINPADPTGKTVFFGGVGIYKSTDSGKNWTFLAANGGTHSDQHAFAFNPSNPDQLLIGNDGGLFAYSLSGANFTALNSFSGGQIQGIGPHPTNNDELLAGFQDNGTDLFSAMINWNQSDTGDGGFALFDNTNPSFAYHTYATTGGGLEVNLANSSDGGLHWTFHNVDFTGLDNGFNFYPPLAADPAVPQRVLLGGHSVYVLDFSAGQVLSQTSQDLNPGCADASCSLGDIEFFPGNDAIAWAVAMQNTQGATLKVWNTTQANCPDQPACTAGQNNTGTWNDLTGNLPLIPAKPRPLESPLTPITRIMLT